MRQTLRRSLLGLAAVLFGTVLWAQTEIQGTVVDETGEPLMGARVQVKGTTTLATTNLDGQFHINPGGGQTLVISFISYLTQEVPAKDGMKVTLLEDTKELEAVVVTGYQVQRKVDLTGAVAVVDTKDMKRAADTDPMRALQGKIAGVSIATDGSPCGTGTVRIRGIGSFNSSQDPLYVIDGVPTTSGLNTLNMNDIESMQVLKDAASASIYGSRAANGVIIITTRKGKKADKVKVDFSAQLTASFYNRQSMMKLCDTKQYATAMAQAALNDGLDPVAYAHNYGLDLNAAGGTAIRAFDPKTMQYRTFTVGGAYDGFINQKRTMRLADTDWLDAISRTGFQQAYDLSVSNATDKCSALFSVGYKKNKGVLKYTDFESLQARMNTSYNVNRYLTIGENATISHSSQVNSFPMENALKMSPTVPLYETDGQTFSGPVGGMSDRQNPLRELYFNRDNRLKILRVFGNMYADIKPVKGLLLRTNFGVDYDQSFIHSVGYTFHSDVVNNSTPTSTVGNTNDMKWTWSNTANYNVDLGRDHDHHLTLLAGIELNSQNSNNVEAYAENYDLETYDYMWPNASTGVQRAHGIGDGYKLVSYFGKIDYNWRDLLLASFTIRRDGSSRFGENNRYATFPAATLGYRLSKHINADWLDELKLRLSAGQTGNQAIANYARYGLYTADYGQDRVTSTAYDLMLQGSGTLPSGFRATQTANPDLKWETTTQYNVGLDYSLLRRELYGTIDVYLKKVKDMLITPAYLGAMGEGGNAWSNGPSLQNWGMEFTLGYRHTTHYDFAYDVNANFAFYRNRVTHLPATTTGSYAHTPQENLVEARQPYGSIVGYVADGLYQNQAEVDASGQPNARVGGLRYKDLDHNGKITSDDQTWIFNPVPALDWGLNIGLRYKGFDLTMFFRGQFGTDVYNNQKFQTDFYSLTDAGSNKGSRMLGAWTPANTSSTIPALTTNNTGDEGRASSYFVESGSWMKLAQMQLGYTVPEKLISRLHMSSARFYLSGQNLFTVKSKAFTCSDPENGSWAYPHSTSFSFGLQLGF